MNRLIRSHANSPARAVQPVGRSRSNNALQKQGRQGAQFQPFPRAKGSEKSSKGEVLHEKIVRPTVIQPSASMALLPKISIEGQLAKVQSEMNLGRSQVSRKTPLRSGKDVEAVFRNPLLDPMPRHKLPKIETSVKPLKSLSDSFERLPARLPETEPVTPHRVSPERLLQTHSKPHKAMRTYQGSEDASLPAVVDVFRVKTRKGMMYGKPKRFNQDVCIVLPDFMSTHNQYFFGAFDGHGTYGHDVSAFVKRLLPLYIENNLPRACTFQAVRSAIPHFPSLEDQQRLQMCIAQAHRTTAEDLTLQRVIDVSFSGTTAISILLRGRFLMCANVGDSRAVVGRLSPEGWYALPLSTDHKPNIPQECLRIESSGGRVEPYSGVPST